MKIKELLVFMRFSGVKSMKIVSYARIGAGNSRGKIQISRDRRFKIQEFGLQSGGWFGGLNINVGATSCRRKSARERSTNLKRSADFQPTANLRVAALFCYPPRHAL
jgi:hypothetical protein